ncbi:MAG: ribokinase [Thermomicrobiales bacterium]
MPDACIISVGSINVDFQMRTDRWPDAGETLVGQDFLMTGGGKGANVAVLARRLGVPAMVIGRVGDDILAGEAVQPMKEDGIDIRHVQKTANTPTAVSTIVVRPSGRKTIILATNANDAWPESDEEMVKRAISDAPGGSVLTIDLEVPVFIVRAAMKAARQRSFKVVLDPSPAGRMEDDLYELIDVVTPNPSEGHVLTHVEVTSPEDARRSGQELLRRGVGAVCQKLAGGGCVLVTSDGTHHIKSNDVEVVDTTGAGDAFAGALSVALLEQKSLRDAARFAVACADVAVTTYGSQEAYPTRDELEQALARLPE